MIHAISWCRIVSQCFEILSQNKAISIGSIFMIDMQFFISMESFSVGVCRSLKTNILQAWMSSTSLSSICRFLCTTRAITITIAEMLRVAQMISAMVVGVIVPVLTCFDDFVDWNVPDNSTYQWVSTIGGGGWDDGLSLMWSEWTSFVNINNYIGYI